MMEIKMELCQNCGRRKTVGEACTFCGALDKAKKPAKKKARKKA